MQIIGIRSGLAPENAGESVDSSTCLIRIGQEGVDPEWRTMICIEMTSATGC